MTLNFRPLLISQTKVNQFVNLKSDVFTEYKYRFDLKKHIIFFTFLIVLVFYSESNLTFNMLFFLVRYHIGVL